MSKMLRDLPGWDEAHGAVRASAPPAAAALLRTCGQFVAPSSVRHVSPTLLRCMMVGLVRQQAQESYRKNPDVFRPVNTNERLEANSGLGDWTGHWSHNFDEGGDPSL
jgi:hypothetical protein